MHLRKAKTFTSVSVTVCLKFYREFEMQFSSTLFLLRYQEALWVFPIEFHASKSALFAVSSSLLPNSITSLGLYKVRVSNTCYYVQIPYRTNVYTQEAVQRNVYFVIPRKEAVSILFICKQIPYSILGDDHAILLAQTALNANLCIGYLFS